MKLPFRFNLLRWFFSLASSAKFPITAFTLFALMQRGEIIIFHWKNCHTRSWSRHHLVHYRIFFDNLLAVKWWNKTTVLRLNHQLPCVRCLRNGFSRYQLIMIKFIKWQISVESWHQRFFMQKSLHCNIQNRQSILCNLTGKLEHLRLLTSQTYLRIRY